MSISPGRITLATIVWLGCAMTTAVAQTGVTWVSFSKQPSKLALSPLAISDVDTQVQFRTSDLDRDGWDDVVAVRKQQASQIGKRAAILLMNDHGVLEDQTALYASASDVAGDSGFLTPCNSYEAAIGDVDGDGWSDVVTCVANSDGAPKSISHPRVYLNRGDDAGGNWLGLRYEAARIPQLKTLAGLAVAPNFCGVGLADVTGDGFPDLYFVDFDGTEAGISEPVAWDLNDRLLVNDGNGFFTDGSAAFTVAQLDSKYAADVEALDINGDGLNDIIKDSATSLPKKLRILYNNPASASGFAAMGISDVPGTGNPRGLDVGDLNHDALLDIAIVEDATDRFTLGTGIKGLGQVVWGPMQEVSFVSGVDDGFGHNVYLRDLDGNGWNDLLVADVDLDFVGCSRRLHVYHNTGSVAGQMSLVLKEEAQFASGGTGAGWKGVVGITAADEKGTYDVAFGDFDQDGDLDLLLGTCSGTNYWQNETNPVAPVCQIDLGFAGPGNLELSLCGDDLTTGGSVAMLNLVGAAPNQPIFLPLALVANPVPLKGGTLVPNPILLLVTGFATSGAGSFSAPVAGAAGSSVHLVMQAIVKNGAVYEFSNALDTVIGF